MMLLGGSFQFVQLSLVAQLLADIRCTGRLHVAQGEWTGDLFLRGGQIIGANLGTERGRPALESMAIGLTEAAFSFVDEPVSADGEPLVDEAERGAYLKALNDERLSLAKLIPTLRSIPKLVDRLPEGMAERQVTIGRATLNLIPVIASGQTLESVARQRGLARTLRDVATLLRVGLVRLELEQTRAVAFARTPRVDPAGLVQAQPVDAATERSVPEESASARPLAGLRAAAARFFLTEEPSEAADRLRWQGQAGAPASRGGTPRGVLA